MNEPSASSSPELWRLVRCAPVMTARGSAAIARLRQAAAADGAPPGLGPILKAAPAANLLGGAMQGSPYLSLLIERDLVRLERILNSDPHALLQRLTVDLAAATSQVSDEREMMRALRHYKAEIALLVALADLGGIWPVMTVTEALTVAADATLASAARFLLRQATAKGQWKPEDADRPEVGSGWIILAMGKHGARELNYSSDIDLIVLYDPERARLSPGVEPQPFFVRLTRGLVRLMEERTGDGYVFRTDLRLRPDAGATQIALSTNAALNYYEAFGQNWERAALIKARPAAGDLVAGTELLKELGPFVWRKYLDYAQIADVHAMKRQINAHRGLSGVSVAGHNIKLGQGGIREIEFFVQTQQLIAGGRQPELRTPRTLDALKGLVARGWIRIDVARELEAAYLFLRGLEHRIQMVADEQTHDLPLQQAELDRFALFCGYAGYPAFACAVRNKLETVQVHYAALFEDSPELTSEGVNMVFAGAVDDPATLAALAKMGYSQPSEVVAAVRGWHHGRYQAVRSPMARERLTEVQPLLIAALADTADPDRAFASFDRFLSELPAGVQLFSLLKANPALMRLVANIMGTAPRLARVLSRRRRSLDAVLDPRTIGAQADPEELDRIIGGEIGPALSRPGGPDMQEVLDRARVIGSEQAFLIGVRVLSGTIEAAQAGAAYALLAERLIVALQSAVERELEAVHGKVPGGGAAVVAMGKLGGCEMTATSDLDLIVIYDFDPAATQTDGPRPISPGQYYSRLTQRLISALSAPTAEGTLYEVDMRLRPSGQKGPVATQLSSFVHYQANEAWTWEQMALTRARAITGPPELQDRVRAAIRTALVQSRDRAKVVGDVRDMRQRIEAEKKTNDIWELKQVRGGLVDIEFMAQYLQLVHAAEHPGVLDQNSIAALEKLTVAGLLVPSQAKLLIPAARLVHDLTQVLRLCIEGRFDAQASPGLKELLVRAGGEPSFAALETRLRATLGAVAGLFDQVII